MKKIDNIQFPYIGELPYINFYRYPPANIVVQDNQQEIIEEVLNSENTDNTNLFTLYVGVPFCRTKCNSCPFFKQLLPTAQNTENLLEEYLSHVINQIVGVKNYGIFNDKNCGAIFLGGGTASLLSSRQIDLLLKKIGSNFNVTNSIEITLEGNPVEFTEEYLAQVHDSGVNRLSIGLQSFHDELLREVLGSPHSFEESYSSIKNAMKIGFNTVNIDLLYGLPQQSFKDWEFDIKTTLEYKPESITTNWYVIHDGSKTEKLVTEKKLNPSGFKVEDIIALEKWTHDYLTKEGYIETRAGDFCLPGHEQNYGKLTYTFGHELIGFGVGAYSFINGFLIEGPKYVNPYKKAIESNLFLAPSKISEKASRRILMERLIMMNLMNYSINKKLFKERFGTGVENEFGDVFDKLKYHNLVKVNDEIILLTAEGKKWRRHIMKEFYSY